MIDVAMQKITHRRREERGGESPCARTKKKRRPEGAACLCFGRLSSLCEAYHLMRTPLANVVLLSCKKPLERPPLMSLNVTPA